jgi:hypothetical protein
MAPSPRFAQGRLGASTSSVIAGRRAPYCQPHSPAGHGGMHSYPQRMLPPVGARARAYSVSGFFTGTIYDASTNAIVDTVLFANPSFRLTDIQGTCQELELQFGPNTRTIQGTAYQFPRFSFDIASTAVPGRLLEDQLCAIAELLQTPQGSNVALTQLLTEVLLSLVGVLFN